MKRRENASDEAKKEEAKSTIQYIVIKYKNNKKELRIVV